MVMVSLDFNSLQLKIYFILFQWYSLITGEPTASRRPATMQKWQRNRQAGGGAVTPHSFARNGTKGRGGCKSTPTRH